MADPSKQLPPGFELDPIQQLPPGFQVDQPTADPAVTTLPQGFEPDTDTWGEVGMKVLQNAPTAMKAGAAGLAQEVTERPLSFASPVPSNPLLPGGGPIPTIMSAADRFLQDARTKARDMLGLSPDDSDTWAKRTYEAASQDLQENAPNVDPESLKGYTYDAAQSFLQMVPGLIAGFATRKPAIGAATMAAPIAGERYGQSRAEGRTPEQAAQDSAVTFFAESIPEMVPLGMLMKPGGKFLWRTLKTAGAGAASEMLTQAIEDGYSAGVLNENMTWSQAWNNMKRAGILGGLTEGAASVVTHPFVGETENRGAGNTSTNVAADVPGDVAPPSGSAPPAPDSAAATTPTRIGPWSPPPMVKDATVGLKMGENRPPVRATIEGIQNGWVYWRDEDGNQQTDREEEFRRDLTTPPPPRRRDAISVATSPDSSTSPPVPTSGDINDFDPNAIDESKSYKIPKQNDGSLSLPDTDQIKRLRDAAAAWMQGAADAQRLLDSGSPQARTPEDIAAMKVEAAKALDQANELQRKITPRRESQDVTAASPEQMAARRLGPLGTVAPGINEATTGPQEFETTAPRPAAPIAQGTLQPVEGSEAENPQEPQFKPKAPPVPWQQRLRQRIAARSARVNDPELLAKQLGTTPEEVGRELLSIAGSGPKAPIQMVRGTLTVDPKTGQVQRSKYAGRFRYTPKPTGEAVQSLSDLVYDSGGMAAGSFGGELEARDLHTAKRPFKGNMVKPGARMNVQDMADHAMQLGYPIKPDATGDHADVDDFLNKLEADDAGSTKTYARGEGPLDKEEAPATPQQRKAAAAARLKELGFEPKGTTHEELEAQLDQYENAIGDLDPIDRLDLHRAMEQENADRLDDDAKAALQREVPDDYPHEYDEEWFRQESGGAAPAAQHPADERNAESAGQAGTEPEIQGTAESRVEGADEAARNTDKEGAQQGQQRHLITDKTAEAQQYVAGGGTPAGWVAEMGRLTGHEHMAIVVDGNVVGATTSGLTDQVNYVVEQQNYDPTNAVALYHNHPSNTALSNADLRALGYPGTGYIVAIGSTGEVSAAALTPEAHRHFAGKNQAGAAGFLSDLYMTVHKMLEDVESNGRKRQELTLRTLAGAGVLDYITTHPMEADHLQAVQAAARMVRDAFEAANVTTSHAPNRSTFYQRPADALAAVSDRTAQKRSERQADPELRELGQAGGGGEESGNQTAGNAAQQRATARSEAGGRAETAIGRLLKDESGALSVPQWSAIRRFFQRGQRQQTPAEVARQGLRNQIGNPDTLQSLSLPGRWFRSAVSLASIDRPSSVYWNSLLRRDHVKKQLEREAIEQVQPYLALDVKERDLVNKVMEHDRLYGVDRKDTGRTVVVRIPDRKPLGEGRPVLSKPGDIVALSKEGSHALHQLRSFFDQRLLQMGEAAARERGYDGEFSERAIQDAIDSAGSPRERKPAQAAMDIFQQTAEMRRTGYVPFQRYGDTFILIKPKAPETATPETAWFELVDTKSAFDKVFSRPGGKPRKALADRVADLEQRFPRDRFDYKIEQATPKAVAELNIPAMERAFATLNLKADKSTQALVDNLMHQIFERRKAGLRKQSQNVPGYSTDFERAITDYVRQTSAIIARMSTRRDVDSAFDAVMAHPTKEVRSYWEAHQHHMEKEGGDFAGLRKLGFFMFLWGSPASAAVNLTQTPLVTTMQLGAWAGPRAATLAHGAMLEGLQAIRVGKTGLEIDFDAVGKTDSEKAMIRQLRDEGRLDPVLTEEFRGFDNDRPKLRPHLKTLGRVYEIGSSGFNATETVNRIAAALSYFRAAQNPQLREKLTKVYANDQNFKEMVGTRNPDPVDIARFGVDETQFIGGKLNRMPAMRGVGALVMQFKTYIANYLRLLHKNFTRMGPAGKMAGTMQLLALLAITGLAGAPFGEDALGAADGIMKLATGIDHNLEYQFRNWLADSGFGEYGAEILTRGIGRSVFGVDLAGRLGMGNIWPDNSYTSLAPILTGTIAAADDAMNRSKTGQPAGALATLAPMMVGKGGADLIKGLIQYPTEGISTTRGNWLVMPDEVTTGDMTRRALGFQPAKATREGERQYQANRIANATQDARTTQLTALARNIVLMQKAAEKGDRETAAGIQKRIDQLYADNIAQLVDPDIPDWQKVRPASRLAVKRRVQSLLQPQISALKRAGKMSRKELLDMPFVEE